MTVRGFVTTDGSLTAKYGYRMLLWRVCVVERQLKLTLECSYHYHQLLGLCVVQNCFFGELNHHRENYRNNGEGGE
jgi:hypothetical protein